MITAHWFWFGMTMTCLIWYSTITIYVAVRGYRDIKGMLKRLQDGQDEQ